MTSADEGRLPMAGTPPVEHGERVQLPCHSCGAYDTHPRHTVITRMDPLEVSMKHFDCCRNDGCPGQHCGEALRRSGGARGEHLIAWVHAEMAAGRR
jgi:hypothetical protein